MISEALHIKKSAEHRAKTPSVSSKCEQIRKSFIQNNKDIRFPCVRFEGEIYKTSATEISISPPPTVVKQKHLIKAIKIAKAIPKVDLVDSFENNPQKFKRPIGFQQKSPNPSQDRKLSLDYSSRFSNYQKFRTNSKEKLSNHEIFKILSFSPKKIITNLQSSQQYVRKNKLSREKITLYSINYSSPRRASYINYYW